MRVLCFRFHGRFGHFLRAEANVNALTYPVPPRTVLLGLAGALLGLTKDDPQKALADALFAVGGSVPRDFWHKANLRKVPPPTLPWTIKRSDKGSSPAEKNTRLPQQWLWKPDYRVWASLPRPFHDELGARIRERRWHFSPCLGLSEMLADVSYLGELEAEPAPPGPHDVVSVFPTETAEIETSAACEAGLAIQHLRMPRNVTPDRVFSHAGYALERQGRPVPVRTGAGWSVGKETVMFL